jgi:anaerobic selenocysteine-containing dehydrogenase
MANSPSEFDEHVAASRRRFLKRCAAAGAAGLGGGGILAACGSGPEGSASCVDSSSLSEEAKQQRQSFEYVAQTPNPDQRCDNCMFWQPDAAEEASCGGCQLFPGAVAAGGYCNSWAAARQ